MGKRPKESLIPVRGKPKPGQPAVLEKPRVPAPQPARATPKRPTGNGRGR